MKVKRCPVHVLLATLKVKRCLVRLQLAT